MGFVEIVSLGILIVVGVAGLAQGGLALAGRGAVPQSSGASRWLTALVFLAGGLSALLVGGLWLLSL